MCGSMSDIPSAAAGLGEEKKKERRKKNKRQDEYIWSALLHTATIIKTENCSYVRLVGSSHQPIICNIQSSVTFKRKPASCNDQSITLAITWNYKLLAENKQDVL